MPVKLNSSGGGSVTIDVPSTASAYTLTAPAVSANLLTSSSQSIPKTALPTGSALQVVQASTAVNISTTSTTFTGSGLTASITPTSSTSKILVMLSGGQHRFTSSGSTGESWIQIWKSVGGGSYAAVGGYGGTDIQSILINYTNSTIAGPHSVQYLDSPSTTSTVTYQPYFKTTSSGITVYYNMASVITYITLIEIAA